METYLALSEAGEYRTVEAASPKAVEKLLKWNEPDQRWINITLKNPLPPKGREKPIYPDISESRYADYRSLANRLNDKVRFYPGSFDKRFVRDIAPQLNRGEPISEKQMLYLEKLQHKYRKQLATAWP